MKNKKTSTKVINIDAGTGRFVTKEFAQKNPKITVRLRVPVKSK